MEPIIFLDVETGGLDPELDALLSVGLALYRNGTLRDVLEIPVLPEGLRLTAEALAVSRIDVVAHGRVALSRAEAAIALGGWVRATGIGDRPRIGGHNVAFDIGFLRRLLGANVYAATFSHRSIDTAVVARFLMDAGLLPEGKGNLGACLAAFDLVVPAGLRHTARGDAEYTALLYGRMVELARRAAVVPA